MHPVHAHSQLVEVYLCVQRIAESHVLASGKDEAVGWVPIIVKRVQPVGDLQAFVDLGTLARVVEGSRVQIYVVLFQTVVDAGDTGDVLLAIGSLPLPRLVEQHQAMLPLLPLFAKIGLAAVIERVIFS